MVFLLLFYIDGAVLRQGQSQHPSQIQQKQGVNPGQTITGTVTPVTNTQAVPPGPNANTTTNSVKSNQNTAQHSFQALLRLNASLTSSNSGQRINNTPQVMSSGANIPTGAATRFPLNVSQQHWTPTDSSIGFSGTPNVTTTYSASTLPTVTTGWQHPVSTVVSFSHRGQAGANSQPSVVTYGGSPITIQPIMSQSGQHGPAAGAGRAGAGGAAIETSPVSNESDQLILAILGKASPDQRGSGTASVQHATNMSNSSTESARSLSNSSTESARSLLNSSTESESSAVSETQNIEDRKKANKILYRWLRANILVSELIFSTF